MNRRQFLGGIVALASVPVVGHLVPRRVAAYAKVETQEISLAWLTKDFARLVLNELDGLALSGLRDEKRLGDDGYTHQRNVAIHFRPEEWPLTGPIERIRERYLQPAAWQMAQSLKAKRINRFAQLALPARGEGFRIFHPETGFSARAVAQYQPAQSFEMDSGDQFSQDEHVLLRFDVLGAES